MLRAVFRGEVKEEWRAGLVGQVVRCGSRAVGGRRGSGGYIWGYEHIWVQVNTVADKELTVGDFVLHKGALSILLELGVENKSFNDLKESSTILVSPNTLSKRLKEAQELELVDKVIGEGRGTRSTIDYTLTDTGDRLIAQFEDISDRYFELKNEMHNLREKMYDKEDEIRQLLADQADQKLKDFRQQQQEQDQESDQEQEQDTVDASAADGAGEEADGAAEPEGSAESLEESEEPDESDEVPEEPGDTEGDDGEPAAETMDDDEESDETDDVPEAPEEMDAADEPDETGADGSDGAGEPPEAAEEAAEEVEDVGEPDESAEEISAEPDTVEEKPGSADEAPESADDEPEEPETDDTAPDYDAVVAADVASVKEQIREQNLDVQKVLEAEKRNQNRDELVSFLSDLIDSVETDAAADEDAGTEGTDDSEDGSDDSGEPDDRQQEIEDLKQELNL